jgi:hypothetical protein
MGVWTLRRGSPLGLRVTSRVDRARVEASDGTAFILRVGSGLGVEGEPGPKMREARYDSLDGRSRHGERWPRQGVRGSAEGILHAVLGEGELAAFWRQGNGPEVGAHERADAGGIARGLWCSRKDSVG